MLALGALAQPSRLRVFRTLVRHAPAGLCATELAAAVELPASTLSFHLRDLCAGGLLRATRKGRTIRYAVSTEAWTELLYFLGEDCCQGRPALCESPSARIRRPARRSATELPAVLFLCSQNSARSQLAEALLRHLAGGRFVAYSAGVRPSRLHPLTSDVLAERGIPTVGLRSKDLGELLGKIAFDHAFVVCDAAQRDCPQLPQLAADQQFWPFPDPAAATGTRAERLATFRAVRDAIEARLRGWLRAQDPRPNRRRRAAGTHPPAGDTNPRTPTNR